MRKLLLILIAFALSTAPAHATGIETAVLGIATWYAAQGAFVQAAIQIGVGLALSAAAYGLSYLISGGGKRLDQSQQQQSGVLIPERDGLLEVRRVYGTQVVAGGIFFQKTVAGVGSSAPNIYVEGRALSEGICDSLVSLIINGVECELTAAGLPLTAPWSDGSNTYLKASFRAGTDTQAIDPIIAARFPGEDVNFRQRGICTVVIEMAFGDDGDHHTELWGAGGIPQIAVKIKGLKVYDRRKATHDASDKTTWSWSNTAALIEADWMNCAIGFGIPHADIDGVEASADFDEDVVPTLGGVEKRGTINGEVGSGEANTDVLESMSQQNRALIRTTLGRYTITAERAADPVCTIHQSLLVGALSYQNEPGKRESINRVDVQFYPASRFNQASETYYEDPALIVVDGETLTRRISLRFCDSPSAAQRLAYGLVVENRDGRTITALWDIASLIAAGKPIGQILEAGDTTRIELRAPYDAINELYRVNSLEIGGDFTVSVSLGGTSASVINGWSTALEQPFTD